MTEAAAPSPAPPRGDLSVTALYTSATWAWGDLPNAKLLESRDAKRVFRVVNAALALARLFFARAAPLPLGLLHRHVLIDRLLEASGARRVVELAAGLSRRGLTVSADASFEYVEVDRPHVVQAKRDLLARSDAGRAALARENWRLVGGDATALDLAAIAPPDGAPLFVIAEGLLMYLAADAQRALFRTVAARLRDGGGTFVFDLVPVCEQPPPGRIGRALEWLMKRFTGGSSFVRDMRTRDDLARELGECGFDRVEMLEPHQVARAWGLPHPDARTQQLVFVGHVGPSSPPSPSQLLPV